MQFINLALGDDFAKNLQRPAACAIKAAYHRSLSCPAEVSSEHASFLEVQPLSRWNAVGCRHGPSGTILLPIFRTTNAVLQSESQALYLKQGCVEQDVRNRALPNFCDIVDL
jgi:hypothetical protein